MFYIMQFRQLGIRDLTFALRSKSKNKKDKCATLDLFDKAGLLRELAPEDEYKFIEALVRTHPTHEKNFEHFLVNPPKEILPSEVFKALQERSLLIPTFCTIITQKERDKDVIIGIERIRDHYDLLSLLSDAEADGLIGDKKGDNEL